jgi:hypothetical protein
MFTRLPGERVVPACGLDYAAANDYIETHASRRGKLLGPAADKSRSMRRRCEMVYRIVKLIDWLRDAHS